MLIRVGRPSNDPFRGVLVDTAARDQDVAGINAVMQVPTADGAASLDGSARHAERSAHDLRGLQASTNEWNRRLHATRSSTARAVLSGARMPNPSFVPLLSSRSLASWLALTACSGEPSVVAPDAPSPDASPDARIETIDAPDSPSGVRRVDLGGIVDGATVQIPIPEHALGFQIVVEVEASAGTETVGIETVTNPSGAVVVSSYAVVGHPAPLAASEYGVATIAIPLTDSAAVVPVAVGNWSATFLVPPGKTARAYALVRTTADGQFHGGALDVRIYIPDGLTIGDPGPAHAITAATASADSAVTARVDAFFATLKTTFDLDRGSVELLPLPSAFSSIDTEAERLQALEATTPFADGLGLHVVWTQDLIASGVRVWGNSAWLPGLPNSPHRRLGAVTLDVASGNPAVADGMTMVHEAGHHLGLFHTSDVQNGFHDPLSDTPQCTLSPCPDRNNIMFATFWASSGGVGVLASPHQRRVVWGSPAYRAH